MATLSQILGKKWPGSEWTLEGDDYAQLRWLSATAKPLEADIRAFSAEVDVLVAADRTEEERSGRFTREEVLRAVDIIADAIDDLQTRANINNGHATKIDALRQKIAQIKAS